MLDGGHLKQMKMNRIWTLGLMAVAGAALMAGCNGGSSTEGETAGGGSSKPAAGGNLTGSISIDGSSTVYPIANTMAEDFGKANSGVKLDVTKSGTGSGFKKFIDGSLDICCASRTIEKEEVDQLKAKGIDYIEVPIAFDGVSIVINPANDFAGDLTADELRKAWAPDSTVQTWADIRAGFPAEKITFYGLTNNHGTYEYFTEKIAGKKNEIRKGYQANQEYAPIVTAVSGDKNGIGYMGYSYYIENKDKLKAVKVNGVEPTPETIENGSYAPLSRTLFMYVSKKAYDTKPEVKAFFDFALGDGLGAVEENEYIKMPQEAYDLVKARLSEGKTGTIFMDAAGGKSTLDILKEAAAK